MSTTFKGEKRDSPELTSNTSIGESSITVRRTFYVESDDLDDGPAEVMSNSSIPTGREAYDYRGTETHSLLKVVSRTAARDEKKPLLWTVTVDYETADYDDDWENPLNDPVEITLSTQQKQVVSYYAVNSSGVPTSVFLSSAGEALQNYPTKDDAKAVLEFTRNEAISTNVISLTNTYVNAVNTDTFWTAGAGFCRCIDINVTRQIQQLEDGADFAYLQIKYKFEFGDQRLYYIDQGSYFLYPPGVLNTTKDFQTDTGQPFIGNLNGAGEPASAPTIRGPYAQYKTAAFSGLSLPTSFAS